MSPPSPRPSLTELARQLGLAPSTVSRALADQPGISAATKARVRQLAEELHYLPNQLAASLRKGRSQTLGVIVPHLTGYFFPAVMTSIEQAARAAGYQVLVCQSNENARSEAQSLEALLAAQVEGVLLSVAAATDDWQPFEQVRRQGTPLVFFDRVPPLAGSTAVVLDDFRGAYEAVTHLIEQGCQRIGHLAGPQNLNTSRHRYEGYREALRAHGLPFEEEFVYALPALTPEAGQGGMRALLAVAPPLDGVFAAYAIAAAGALEVLETRGVRVPEQVALACFSNDPFTSMTRPRLTVVDQRAAHMGETAVRLLLQLLKRGAAYRPPHIVIKPQLHVRESSRRK